MSRLNGLFLVVGFLFAVPSQATAQRPIIIPAMGDGERVVYVADLPPHLKPVFGPEARIGFYYWYFCVGSEHCKLWTSDGKFVLYEPKKMAMWDIPEDELLTALGPESADQLSRPWTYYLTPAQIVILVLVALIVWLVYRSGKREKVLLSLDQDPRYQKALQVYA